MPDTGEWRIEVDLGDGATPARSPSATFLRSQIGVGRLSFLPHGPPEIAALLAIPPFGHSAGCRLLGSELINFSGPTIRF